MYLHRRLEGGCSSLGTGALGWISGKRPHLPVREARVKGPEDRLLYFDGEGNLLFNGSHVRERIQSASFALTEFTVEQPEVSRSSLLTGEEQFLCRKR